MATKDMAGIVSIIPALFFPHRSIVGYMSCRHNLEVGGNPRVSQARMLISVNVLSVCLERL